MIFPQLNSKNESFAINEAIHSLNMNKFTSLFPASLRHVMPTMFQALFILCAANSKVNECGKVFIVMDPTFFQKAIH